MSEGNGKPVNQYIGLTPVQQKMLTILADGMPHTREELHSCLSDNLGDLSNIQPHLTGLRKHLRYKGEDIMCERQGMKVYYRQVRLLASAYDGKK